MLRAAENYQKKKRNYHGGSSLLDTARSRCAWTQCDPLKRLAEEVGFAKRLSDCLGQGAAGEINRLKGGLTPAMALGSMTPLRWIMAGGLYPVLRMRGGGVAAPSRPVLGQRGYALAAEDGVSWIFKTGQRRQVAGSPRWRAWS